MKFVHRIVCMEDIDVGEEILLDYGEAYNKMYLLSRVPQHPVSIEDMHAELPGFGSDNDTDSDEETQKWKVTNRKDKE